MHEILDAEIGAAGVFCHGWIAKKIEITFSGRESRAGFVWGTIQHVASRSADYGVISSVDMGKRQHLGP